VKTVQTRRRVLHLLILLRLCYFCASKYIGEQLPANVICQTSVSSPHPTIYLFHICWLILDPLLHVVFRRFLLRVPPTGNHCIAMSECRWLGKRRMCLD